MVNLPKEELGISDVKKVELDDIQILRIWMLNSQGMFKGREFGHKP